MKLSPYKFERGRDDRTVICTKYRGEIKKFVPEEIVAMILLKLKADADKFLE